MVVSAVLDTGPNLSILHAIYKEIKVNGCTLIPWSVAKTRREQNHAAHIVDVGLITNTGAVDVGYQNSHELHRNHVLLYPVECKKINSTPVLTVKSRNTSTRLTVRWDEG